jgi:hypothetical protein
LRQENGLNEDRVAESLIAEFSLNVGFSVEIRKCPMPQLGLQPEGPHARAAAPRQRASNAEAAARRPVEGGLRCKPRGLWRRASFGRWAEIAVSSSVPATLSVCLCYT